MLVYRNKSKHTLSDVKSAYQRSLWSISDDASDLVHGKSTHKPDPIKSFWESKALPNNEAGRIWNQGQNRQLKIPRRKWRRHGDNCGKDARVRSPVSDEPRTSSVSLCLFQAFPEVWPALPRARCTVFSGCLSLHVHDTIASFGFKRHAIPSKNSFFTPPRLVFFIRKFLGPKSKDHWKILPDGSPRSGTSGGSRSKILYQGCCVEKVQKIEIAWPWKVKIERLEKNGTSKERAWDAVEDKGLFKL